MKFLTFIAGFSIIIFLISIDSINNYSFTKKVSDKNRVEAEFDSKFSGFNLKKTRIFKFGKKIVDYGKKKIKSIKKFLNIDKKPAPSKPETKTVTREELHDIYLNDIGSKFCKDKCKIQKNDKSKKCLEGKVNSCNFCVHKKHTNSLEKLKENKLCMDLCNQIPKRNECQFYPYKITVMRKKFDDKTLENSIKKYN